MASPAGLKKAWSLIVAVILLIAALAVFVVWRLLFPGGANDVVQNLVISTVTILLVVAAMWVVARARRRSLRTIKNEETNLGV